MYPDLKNFPNFKGGFYLPIFTVFKWADYNFKQGCKCGCHGAYLPQGWESGFTAFLIV